LSQYPINGDGLRNGFLSVVVDPFDLKSSASTEPREAVNRVLKSAGFAVPEIEPGYRFHFYSGAEVNRAEEGVGSLADVSRKQRPEKKINQRAMREHYPPQTTRLALATYALDYRLLPGLVVPAWAVRSAGESFVRRLGLPFAAGSARSRGRSNANNRPGNSPFSRDSNSESDDNHAHEPHRVVHYQAVREKATRQRPPSSSSVADKAAAEGEARRRREEKRSKIRLRAARYKCAISKYPNYDPECLEAKAEHLRSINLGNF
jgi:hypothetical protein